jgi:hypothetical protein
MNYGLSRISHGTVVPFVEDLDLPLKPFSKMTPRSPDCIVLICSSQIENSLTNDLPHP